MSVSDTQGPSMINESIDLKVLAKGWKFIF